MLGGLGELVDWFRAAIAGWRFIFVPSYRDAVVSGWKFERWYYIAWDVMLGLAGILFSIALAIGFGFIVREILSR